MLDRVPNSLQGAVRIFPLSRPKDIVFARKNIICNTTSYLMAQLFLGNTGLVAGVWGLALGAGGSTWGSNTQPDPTATQIAMLSEIKRKQLAEVQFLDINGAPTNNITNVVDFTTVVNATKDNITLPIREMGLIGGGISTQASGGPTNMLTAPYFDPTAPVANSITLINYMTLPPLLLPAGVDFGVAWTLLL